MGICGRRGRGRLAIALVMALAAARADAASSVVELDAGRSALSFSLDSTLHEVHGTARLTEGRVTFDPSGGEAGGRLVVDARSADTGNRLRDRQMHRKVLESERFEEIVFVPASLEVTRVDGNRARVVLAGSMQIHGSEWPLRIPADLTVDGEQIHIQGTFTVPYVEWGMQDMSKLLLRVSPEVVVAIDAFGTIRPPPIP